MNFREMTLMQKTIKAGSQTTTMGQGHGAVAATLLRFIMLSLALLPLHLSAASALFLPPPDDGFNAAAYYGEQTTSPAVIRSKLARINLPLLVRSGGALQAAAAGEAPSTVQLNLFNDRSLTVNILRTEVRGASKFVSYGKVAGEPRSQVILSVDSGVMAASLFVPGTPPVQISYAGNGAHRITELDMNNIPGCGADDLPHPAATALGLDVPAALKAVASKDSTSAGLEGHVHAQAIPATAGDAPTTIDVMVVYTTAAKGGAGGLAGMNALIDLAVAEANAAYSNSLINVQLNLVYRGEVSYTETANASTDLTHLQSTSDGQLDSVHALRTQYGADLVTLVVETMNTYAGLGYVMSPPSSGFDVYGFNVVLRSYMSGTYTYAHELGHNMGCAHDRQNSTSQGAYSYSYGYRFTDTNNVQYRTVMAYAPGARIPYFSNPNVSFNGTPTGVDSASTNSADNAASINNTAATVAAFRSSSSLFNFDGVNPTVGESDGTVTFTVLRSGSTASNATVAFATSAGTALAGSDYAATNGTLTFLVGEASKTITVRIINNAVVEPSETFTVRISSPSAGSSLGTLVTATATITDDDTGFNFSASTASISEGATNVVVTVLRTGDTNATATVDYATTNLTALAGTDYDATTGTLTFDPGTNSLTITIPITDDSLVEGTETFKVGLSNPSAGSTIGGISVATVSILDNDSSVYFSTNAVYVLENITNATVVVYRAGGTNNVVTVDYLTVDNSALTGSDYTSTNGTLTFNAGVTNLTVRIPIINDSTVETNKDFSLLLTNVSVGSVLGANTNIVITIKDNDSLIGFSTNAVTVAESVGNLLLSVRRSGGLAAASTVAYRTSTNGVAVAGSDFTAASGILSFAANETNKTITIPITNDAIIEGDETFTVTLSSPTGEAVLSTSVITVTISDNDSTIAWATNTTTVNEGAGTVSLTLLRAGTLTLTNSILFSVKAGTAGSSDYVSTNGTITFLPNETNKTVTVGITDDVVAEVNETFGVVISAPTGGAAILGTNTTYVTITDNDAGVTIATNRYSISEGGTNVVLTVNRFGDTNSTVQVDYSTVDGGAVGGSDFTSVAGSLVFTSSVVSMTITVPITDDSVIETNETFRVILSNPTLGAVLGTNAAATVTILENDSTVRLTTNVVSVLENATNTTVTVLRAGGTNYTVTVDFLTSDGTATAASDYSATNGTLTFGPGITSRTVLVPILNDTNIEGNETFRFALTNLTGGATFNGATNLTATILDNDSVIDFVTSAITVAESVGSNVVTVVRTGGVAAPATVAYATVPGSASAGLDYTSLSGTLTFNAGETNKTITLVIKNDTLTETNETFSLILTNTTGEAVLGTNSPYVVTITDDDTSYAFSTNAYSVNETAGTVTLSIDRTGTLSTTNTVRAITRVGTAGTNDFIATNVVVTFLPTETNKTVTIGIVHDSIVESSETFTVSLTNVTGGAVASGVTNAVVTIVDNDNSIVIAAGSLQLSVSEGASNAIVTIQRTGDLATTNTVDYATADNSALAGSDYTNTTGTLTFNAGTNSLTISIPIIDDSTVETNENFRLVISNPGLGAVITSTNTSHINILENDSLVRLSTNALSVLETGTNAILTVTRSGGTNYSVTVDVALFDGTATNTVNFSDPTNATVTFGPGVVSQTVYVPLINDTNISGDLTFSLILTNELGGAILGSVTNATITIRDTDSIIDFTTNAVTLSETSITNLISVTRTGGLAATQTVAYATSDISAVAPGDYRATNGTITFAPGETNKTITLVLVNDWLIETNETFALTISSPTGDAALGTNGPVTFTITDDDSSITFTTNAVSFNETAGTVTVSVDRTGLLTTTNAIQYIYHPGTASVLDYVGTNGTLVFLANETNKLITFSLVDDSLAETTEAFTLSLTNGTGGGHPANYTNLIVTILDDDAGDISFSTNAVTFAESAGTVTLSVDRGGILTGTNTVQYVFRPGTAGTNDYTGTNGVLTFQPNETNKTVTFAITEDKIVELSETFVVSLTNAANGGHLIGYTNAAVTITDNDASVAFAATTASVSEGGTNIVLTVNRSGDTNGTATIDYATANLSALSGSDYTSTTGTLTFTNGVLTQTLTVPITDDSLIETNEQFRVFLSNSGANTAIGTSSNATVTILENDSLLRLSTNAVSLLENATNALFTILRTGGTNYSVTVDYQSVVGTAGTNDFTLTNATVTFGPGVLTRTFVIPINNDTNIEGNETFTVALTNAASGGILGTITNATVTILDNDSTFDLLTNAVSVLESVGTNIVTVRRTGGVAGPATVDYQTANGTASSLGDYRSASGTLTFAANETNKTISIVITNDTLVEASEDFTLTLSAPTGEAVLTTNNVVTVTILDNDNVIAFSTNAVSVAETAGSLTLDVYRTGTTTYTNTVRYAFHNGSALAADFSGTNGILTFLTGETNKTITVPIIHDSLIETNESFVVSLTNVTGGSVLSGYTNITVTITETDNSFTMATATAAVSEGATNVVLTVNRTGSISGTNTIDYATTGISATAGSDYTATSGTLTFNAGETNKTITVAITDDSTVETNETFRVTLSNPSAGGLIIGITNTVVTILENDSTIQLSTNLLSVLENGTNASVRILRTGGTNYAVTVDYYLTDGTATNLTNYLTPTNLTVTFNPGVTTQTVLVPIVNDSNIAGDLTFALSLTNATGGGTLGAFTNLTITMLDNDAVIDFTTNAISFSEAVFTNTITLTRTGGVSGAATVAYTMTAGTATSADFRLTNGIVSFAAGETNKTFSLYITNDVVVEGDETFTITLSSPTGEAVLGTNSPMTVTIVDDDSNIGFTASTYSVGEGDGIVTLSVDRTGTLSLTNTLRYVIRPGSATNADYTGTTGLVTFLPTETNQTFTVAIVDDGLVETNESFTVYLTNGSSGVKITGNTNTVVTIVDNDTGFRFASTNYSISEDGNLVTLTVNRSGDLSFDATVDYATTNMSALAGSDYTNTSGTLTFASNVTTLTVTVPIIDDTTIETNEQFRVLLSNASANGYLLSPSSSVVTILENDSLVNIATNAYSIVESGTNLTVQVRRTGGTNYAVSVDFTLNDVTATNAVDYTTPGTTTLTFDPGVILQTVIIPIINDTNIEGNETFTMTLTNAINGGILGTNTNSVITIVDNDGLFNFRTNAATVSESVGNMTINVRRTGGVGVAGTVHYATTAGTATAGSDFTTTSGNLAFNANETNKTITVVILNDAVTEADETFTVVLSAPSGENVIGSNDTLTVTIADDDFGGAEDPNGLKATRVASVAWETSGTVHLTLTGPSGTVTLQRSTDLIKWDDLAPIELVNRTGEFRDSDPAKPGTRFYRVIRPLIP